MDYRQSSNLIEGVHQGILVGQQSRMDDLNTRIQSRDFPDQELAPNFSMRPTPTKYSRFPIINMRAQCNETIKTYTPHSTTDNFNPGTRNAPVGTYLANIDTETQLRYQPFSVRHTTRHDLYVPSSASDLYNTQVHGRQEENTHPLLFKKDTFVTKVPSILANGTLIGADRFSNHTRTQLRNMSM